MMAYFAATYPSICKIDTILDSTPSGYRILAAHISDNVNTQENEPQFLYSSSIHGDETTGYYLMLRLINYLLSNYGTLSKVTNLVNNVDIWICPAANPEGTYYKTTPRGSDVDSSRRGNFAGIDLNRNFPGPTSTHPDGNAYQPETQAFMTFADNHHFNMAANFHGGTELANYPWDTWVFYNTVNGTINENADYPWWERVCANYVATTRVVTPSYMNTVNFPDGVTEGGDWYVILGGRQDYMNWFKHCREVTFEVSVTKLVETQNLAGFWNTNYQALLGYMEESLYGIRGVVTDGCTGSPIKAKVIANGYDQISGTGNDSSLVYSALPLGNYHKYVNTGTYSLTFSAPGHTSVTIPNISVTNGSASVVNVVLAPSTGGTIPTFTTLGPYCSGATPAALPTTSTNGITGTWSPAAINTATAGVTTYIFTPNSGQCASTAVMNVTITPGPTGVTATASDNSICIGESFNLISTGTTTTTFISPTTDGGFENGFLGWNVVNGASNTWVAGPAAGAHSGVFAAYIGTLADYKGTASAKVNHFYRDIVIPTGYTNIVLSFYLKMPLTDATTDFLYVYTTTTGNTPVAGTTPGTGYTQVFSNSAAISTYTLKTVTLPNSLAGTTVRLVFTYKCDNTTAYAVPAVDDISLTATSASTYSWTSSPSGYTSSLQNPTGVTPSATTQYIVNVSNTLGCASSANTTVTVSSDIIPTFTQLGPYCVGSTPGTLPTTSTNGITGTWSPATISTASAGTTVYTFTPTAGQCAVTTTMSVVVNTVPTITGTTPASRCGTGTVGLGASASAGTINWYAASTGGTSLGTGTSYTTPSISSTTTYYVDATNNGCTTASRTSVIATVNAIPTITGTTPGSVCVTGTVGLGASASAGTINWYAASTGGSSLGTGTSFTTPSISTTTTYYVDATNSGCTTASRTSVVATVNSNTAINSQSTAAQTQCMGGTFTAISVTATGTNLTYQWYSNTTASTSGGTSLGSANGAQTSTYTPQVSAIGTLYYYCIVSGSCGTSQTSAISGAFKVNTAALGYALQFNGTTQYVETASAVIPSSGDYTVSVWANHVSTQTGSFVEILSQGTSGNAFYIGISSTGYMRFGDSWYITSTPYPTDNLWHNYTVVKTATNAYYYLDGVLTLTHGSTIANPSASVFRIGCQYGGSITENFQGKVDEVYVWSRALSSCEIASNYTKTLTGGEQNLTHYYNFNQSGGTVLTDQNASPVNGTLYFSPLWVASGAGVTDSLEIAASTTGSSAITNTTATVSGSVTSGTATERGVVYNTSTCPTTANSKQIATVPTGSGTFQSDITGLSSGTTYYARAYATDASGTAYGAEISFTTTSCVSPSISSQSTAAQTKCLGETFSAITVTASGTGLSYQWYSNTSSSTTGGTSLGSANGAQTSSYIPQATVAGTLYYYCIVTGTCGSATSAVSGAFVVNSIPSITGTTPGSVCGTGTVGLGASASAGTINWYAASTGGSSLGTGTSYTTPSISSTTTYYVDATNNGCTTASRTSVIATVNAIPTITGTTPGSVCGTGTVTLGAAASAGTINWYVASTGGSSLGTGTSYTTPSISTTTTYYVDATNNGCTTASRTSVIATVNAIPSITGTTPASRCGTGTVTLGASASAGTINWYAGSTGGSSLGTGTSFTTPSISTTTTYYVDATNNGCTIASRTSVIATVNAIPTITGTTPGSVCGTGTVTLGASASAGTINWYAGSTGGSSLGTGTSFTTPSISTTTTYYVDATNNGCTTASRTSVIATVNAIPTITGTTPGSVCGTGTVTLGATASAGTINWYAASTGGSSLGIGTSYTTPSISSTTTYYVDATNNGCTTASRTSVIATVYKNTWSGAVSNDWSNAGNWSCGVVPANNEDVIIAVVTNYPVITTGQTIACRDLTTNDGASVTVNVGGALTVNGNLTVEGTNGIIVKSDATGNGSLITLGTNTYTGSGSALVEKYMPSSAAGRWTYFSNPVDVTSSSLFTTATRSLYYSNEPTNAWVAITNAAPSNMTIMKGYGRKYLDAEADAGVKNFTGAVNTGAQSINLTRTEAASGEKHGWNLLGNPYPSALNWDATTGWTKTNIQGAIYYRGDGVTYAYVDGLGTGNATGIIPSMSSFWVRVDSLQTTGSLAVTNDARVHSAPAGTPTYTNTLHLTVSDGTNQDDTYLRFRPTAATDGFDASYDAYKWMATTIPQIYTRISGAGDMAINSMAALSGSPVIPVGFNTTAASGTYTITANLFSSFGANTVYLRDNLTGTLQDLSSDNTYEFTADATSGVSRFDILINPSFSVIPTIALINNSITVNAGTTTANLNYSGTTHNPNTYSINFDATANTAGFVDVVGAVLPVSPIVVNIPSNISTGTYQAVLTVTNTIIPATSVDYPITIVVNPVYTFTQDIGTTLQVGFTPLAGASLYTVSYRVSGGSWIGKSTATNSVKILNLTPGTNYEWKVTAYNSGGTQIMVYPSTFYTVAANSFTKTFDIGTTCQLSWLDCSAFASSYVLQYKPQSSSTWTNVGVTTNSKKLSNLTSMTTYDVKVAVYISGNLWGTTVQSTFTTGTVNFTPTNVTKTSATISWAATLTDMSSWVSNSVFYYRKNGTTTWSTKIISGNGTSVNLTGLTKSTTYQCYVTTYLSSVVWGSTVYGTFTTASAKDLEIISTNINAYPNPFNDKISLNIFTEEATDVVWNLYDLTGAKVLGGVVKVNTGNTDFEIDGTSLPSGIYMLNAVLNDELKTLRIVKN